MLNIAPGVWPGAVHGWDTWAFTIVLAIVFPILDSLLYSRLKSTLQIYVWNICAEWSLVASCGWAMRRNGLRLTDLGEQLGDSSRTLAVSAVLLVLIAGMVIAGKRRKREPTAEQLTKALSRVKRLLPITRAERAVFVAVALTAGVCEEFLYRGWLLNLTGTALGSVWAGLVVSSIVFGLAHAYQGRSGVIGTGVLGIVFGLMFVLTRSLLPGQVLHTAIDLNNGLAMGRVAGRLEAGPTGTSTGKGNV